MARLLLLLLPFVLLPATVTAYPKLLTDDMKCSVPLAVGQKIMGAPVELSKDTIVTVTRADGKALASGDAYVPGEVLKIGLPVDIPGVFETMGGDFVKGACGARRILPDANGFADFTAPKDGLDVMLWAGYAEKHGAVTVTHGFLLKGAQGTRAMPPGVTPPPPAASTTNVAKAGTPPAAAAAAAGGGPEKGKEEEGVEEGKHLLRGRA